MMSTATTPRTCWVCETTDSAEWWTDGEHTMCTRCAAKGDEIQLGAEANTKDISTYALLAA